MADAADHDGLEVHPRLRVDDGLRALEVPETARGGRGHARRRGAPRVVHADRIAVELRPVLDVARALVGHARVREGRVEHARLPAMLDIGRQVEAVVVIFVAGVGDRREEALRLVARIGERQTRLRPGRRVERGLRKEVVGRGALRLRAARDRRLQDAPAGPILVVGHDGDSGARHLNGRDLRLAAGVAHDDAEIVGDAPFAREAVGLLLEVGLELGGLRDVRIARTDVERGIGVDAAPARLRHAAEHADVVFARPATGLSVDDAAREAAEGGGNVVVVDGNAVDEAAVDVEALLVRAAEARRRHRSLLGGIEVAVGRDAVERVVVLIGDRAVDRNVRRLDLAHLQRAVAVIGELDRRIALEEVRDVAVLRRTPGDVLAGEMRERREAFARTVAHDDGFAFV